MAAPLLSTSDAVGCPASGEDGPENRMVAIGRLRVETTRCWLDIGRQLCTARRPVKQADSRPAPPAVAERRRSAGEQAWSFEAERAKYASP